MAELADALGSGPSDRKVVEVRVLLSAPKTAVSRGSSEDFSPQEFACVAGAVLVGRRHVHFVSSGKGARQTELITPSNSLASS